MYLIYTVRYIIMYCCYNNLYFANLIFYRLVMKNVLREYYLFAVEIRLPPPVSDKVLSFLQEFDDAFFSNCNEVYYIDIKLLLDIRIAVIFYRGFFFCVKYLS